MKQRNATPKETPDAVVHEIVKQRNTTASALVVPDDTPILDEASTVTSIGRLILFNCQSGVYSTHDDGEAVPQDAAFIAHAGDARHGWIRFDPDGGPVTSVTGGFFDPDWKLPSRQSLGETDESQWRVGLSSRPESPWKQTVSLPLEGTVSGAFFSLNGNTPTTVNGLYKFLNEYKLLRRRCPDALPVIRLASGTYTSRFGSLVHKPVLITLRRVSGGDLAPPDTSLPRLLDDEIRF